MKMITVNLFFTDSLDETQALSEMMPNNDENDKVFNVIFQKDSVEGSRGRATRIESLGEDIVICDKSLAEFWQK